MIASDRSRQSDTSGAPCCAAVAEQGHICWIRHEQTDLPEELALEASELCATTPLFFARPGAARWSPRT